MRSLITFAFLFAITVLCAQEVLTAEETSRTVPGNDVTLHDVVVRASRRP